MASDSVNLPPGYQLDQPSVPAGYTVDPQTSTLGALGRGALDAVPFGTKAAAGAEAAVGSDSYDKYLNELDSLLASDKAQHPIAHGAGETAGTLAPLAIPGVGEALEAETLAGRAGIGAGIGALQGASNNRDASHLPTDILKSGALGAAVGPAAGALGDVASDALSKASSAADDFSNSSAVKTLGMRPATLGKMGEEDIQDLGKFAVDNGLTTGDLPTRLKTAQVLKQTYGNKIGEMGDKAATLQDPTPYAEALKDQALPYASSQAPEANALAKTYHGGAQDIENLGPGASYQDIQELKGMYGNLAFDAAHQVKNPAAADVYGTLKQMQKDIIADSPEDYQNVMKGYSNSADITDGLQRQLGTARAGGSNRSGMIGMRRIIGSIPGMDNPAIGLPTGAGIAATGHPLLGAMVGINSLSNPAKLSALAGGASSALAKGAQGLSNVAPGAANGATNALNGPKIPPQYRQVFAQATTGLTDPAEIQKQTSITDFVLQSRDPNYVKAKADQSDAQ